MRKMIAANLLLMTLWAIPALAIGPTLTTPHRLTSDALNAADNPTGVNIYYAPSITGITKASPGVVTTTLPHGLTSGGKGTFMGLGGMTQLNGVQVTVTVLTATTYSIGVNTTAYGAYTTGGGLFDDGHKMVDGRIDTAPYDLMQLGLPNGAYQISASEVSASGESGLSNVVPFSLQVPGAPQNLRTTD